MTEDQIRQIIAEELAKFIMLDRYVFDKKIQILNGQNIQVGKANGTKIGTEATQKLGFFGATPVTQQLKASHNNWANLSDVVSALVNLGLLDQS